jgi:diguanylate cyclase (GGDEF)-like protein/PAS domain S-box-containing protein
MVCEHLQGSEIRFEIYKSHFDVHPDASYVIDLDGYFIYINDSSLSISGYTREELLNMSFPQILVRDEIEKVYRNFESIKKGNCEKFETAIISKSGEKIELFINGAPLIMDNTIQGIIGIAKDITESNKIQKKLTLSQKQLQNISDSINVCLWTWELEKKDNHLYISPACQNIYGYSQDEFYKDPYLWKKVIHPDDMEAVEKRQNFNVNRQSIKHQYRIIGPQGVVKWVNDYTVPIFDETGQLIRLDGVISDITQEKVGEEKLKFLAYHDPLTELPNRSLFMKKLNEAILRAKETNKKAAIVYLDVDKFKDVNDTLGHDLGDVLLQAIACRLMESIRPGDTISRLLGDEFTFLLEDIDTTDEVYRIAKKIESTFLLPFQLQNNEFFLTSSIGISLYPDHGCDASTLMKHADQAMYLAKKEGKGDLKLYHHEISDGLARRIFLSQSLYKAFDYDELSLFYQPIVSVKEKKIEGLEALVRWNHTTQGPISPLEFIPIAEESGFIKPLGEWILKKACFDNKELQEKGYPPIYTAVNISARQLEHRDFLPKLKQLLNESGLNPKFLKIEITESTALTNVQDMFAVLNELGEMGIQISIDDFGTGYSALSYLKKLPVQTLKIDKSFIRDINNDSNQEAIIKAIIAMSKSLKIRIVAEGAEEEYQISFLEESGCDAIQGFFYHKPMPFHLLKKMFAASQHIKSLEN